uniref:Large ribosomal subunit protein bL33m n=3 Tax=Haplochromini TaxID=319058 RepID=A0A3Q3C0Z8_HAPBU
MFLTTVNLAKAKSKTILVQMVSAAGTGYFFNTKRNRLRDKLVLRKHDPFGKSRVRTTMTHKYSLKQNPYNPGYLFLVWLHLFKRQQAG